MSTAFIWMTFTNTSRDGNVSNPEHNGITNLYVMQPTTLGGSTDPQPGTLFTQAGLGMAVAVHDVAADGLHRHQRQPDLELVRPHRPGRQHLVRLDSCRRQRRGRPATTATYAAPACRGRCASPWPTRPARTCTSISPRTLPSNTSTTWPICSPTAATASPPTPALRPIRSGPP